MQRGILRKFLYFSVCAATKRTNSAEQQKESRFEKRPYNCNIMRIVDRFNIRNESRSHTYTRKNGIKQRCEDRLQLVGQS